MSLKHINSNVTLCHPNFTRSFKQPSAQSCWHAWVENETLSQHYNPTQKVNFSADSSGQVVAADGAFPFGQ